MIRATTFPSYFKNYTKIWVKISDDEVVNINDGNDFHHFSHVSREPNKLRAS